MKNVEARARGWEFEVPDHHGHRHADRPQIGAADCRRAAVRPWRLTIRDMNFDPNDAVLAYRHVQWKRVSLLIEDVVAIGDEWIWPQTRTARLQVRGSRYVDICFSK